MIAPASVLLDDSALRFPSLASLRAAHGDLLRRQRDSADPSAFLSDVEMFLRRGRATGALLDETEQRWEAQSILDYWVTFLFRAERRSVDATLDDFDPELAPRLDDADCPYVGLDAFRESKVEFFFGRKRMIDAMVGRLAAERFLAVVGDSGSGKSSVVLAGFLPVLRAGGLPGSGSWRYLKPLVPGPEPLVNLVRAFSTGTGSDPASRAAVLREDPRRVVDLAGEDGRPSVLVVDQCEEVFTLCDDEGAREAFLAGLAALVESPGLRHTVLLTMRSEYQDHVAKLERFQILFEKARFWVTPLSASELREAIVRPAEIRGLKFEEGVVDALLREILGEPAGLPLLQFTLLKLWESRERNRVTWEAYRKLGGGRLALARSADAFYDELLPQEQITTRRILLRMVRTSERLEVMSSRVQRKDLHRGGEASVWIDRMLDKLVAAHLVRFTPGETPEEDQFEVAHEALVRNWPTLVDWLEQERAEITTRRRLEAKVEEWLRLERQGGLLDEIQIQEAERWLASASASLLGYRPELPALVAASRSAIDEAERKEEDARRRELEQARQIADAERRRAEDKARSSRIFRSLAVAMAALFLLSLWTGWRAVQAQHRISQALKSEEQAKTVALQQKKMATKRAQEAITAQKRADRERQQAERAQQQALAEKRLADVARGNAEAARLVAAQESRRAMELRKAAEAAELEVRQALEEVRWQKKISDDALVEKERALAEARAAQERAEAEKTRAEEALARYEQARQQIADTRSQNVQLKEAPARPSSRVIASPQELKLDRRSRPLRIGSSIGSEKGATGSLCCVVYDVAGRTYLLSLPPIFDGEPGTAILQPGRGDGGNPEKDRIAVLTRVGSDRNKSGAIARLEPGVIVDPRIPKAGPIRGIETTVRPGDKVRLVGRSSGVVEGRVIQADDREVVTSIIPSSGDVGGAVVSDDGDLIGLLYGGDKQQSFVVRILPILRELGVDLGFRITMKGDPPGAAVGYHSVHGPQESPPGRPHPARPGLIPRTTRICW